MLSTDREEFEAQIAILCAGYDKPIGERIEAYWKGCATMSLIEFARCVEYALSQDGPEKLPNTHVMWEIQRKLKARGRPQPASVATPGDVDPRDHLEYYANRLLLRHLITRQGLGSVGTFVPGDKTSFKDALASQELIDCRKAVRALVNWFIKPVLEGDELATPQLFIGQFIRTVAAVSKITPEALKEWQQQCDDPAARIPFPPWMARPLGVVPKQLEAQL